MLTKAILFCGVPQVLVCDGKCEKAWGINTRPRDAKGSMLGDDELGIAPTDPGTTEGPDGKPVGTAPDRQNRWCARECERSVLLEGASLVPFADPLRTVEWLKWVVPPALQVSPQIGDFPLIALDPGTGAVLRVDEADDLVRAVRQYLASRHAWKAKLEQPGFPDMAAVEAQAAAEEALEDQMEECLRSLDGGRG